MKLFPMQWPYGAEDGWFLRQVEAKAAEVIDLHEFSDAINAENAAKIEELAQKVGIPSTFRNLAWRQTVEWRLDARTYPVENYAHLKQSGSWGSFMDLGSPEFRIFAEVPELIALLGESLAGGRAMSRK